VTAHIQMTRVAKAGLPGRKALPTANTSTADRQITGHVAATKGKAQCIPTHAFGQGMLQLCITAWPCSYWHYTHRDNGVTVITACCTRLAAVRFPCSPPYTTADSSIISMLSETPDKPHAKVQLVQVYS
jgi:hypothetical protein